MKKKDFINIVKKNGNYKNLQEAERAVKSVINSIKEILKNDGRISITNFGSFYNKVQKSKEGKIPGTDKIYFVKEKKVPKFKASSIFKKEIENI